MKKQIKQILALFLIVSSISIIQPFHNLLAENRGIDNLRQTGKAFTNVAKIAAPAVVFIKVEKEVDVTIPKGFMSPFGQDLFDDEMFRYFFGEPFGKSQPRYERKQLKKRKKQRQVAGQGSGFIISKDGYILTNSHVVGNADIVKVSLKDGREFEAKIIGTDPQSDVAVIKIEGHNFPYVGLGDSEKLEVGEWVVAIGNPFGLSNSLTAGIVSAKGRNKVGIANYENFIQTDAAINPGNSGGPLINLDGEVIGINTAIFSRSGGYMGIGFAIPINMAKNIKNQLISHGEVTRGYLGIIIQDLSIDLAKTFKLDTSKGILVSQVTDDSPAQKGGLQQGDIIIEFQGNPVKKVGEFRNRVALTAPETRCVLVVMRKGKRKRLDIKIGELDKKEKIESAKTSKTIDKMGLTLQDITTKEEQKYQLHSKEGVVVTHVEQGSIADLASIREGSVIIEINQQRVSNVREFKKVIEHASKQSSRESGRLSTHVVLLLVKERGYARYITLPIK